MDESLGTRVRDFRYLSCNTAGTLARAAGIGFRTFFPVQRPFRQRFAGSPAFSKRFQERVRHRIALPQGVAGKADNYRRSRDLQIAGLARRHRAID